MRTPDLCDINCRNILWDSKNNSNGKILVKACQELNLDIHYPDEPTRYSSNGKTKSVIDLALTRNCAASQIKVLQDLNSDHRLITIAIPNLDFCETNNRIFKNYPLAGWAGFKTYIHDNTILNRSTDMDANTIDLEIAKLTEIIQTATDRYIPNLPQISPYKLPPEIEQLRRTRNRSRRIFQRNPSRINRTILLANDAEFQTELIKFRVENWIKSIKIAKEKRDNVWKEVKARKNGETGNIPTLTTTRKTAIISLENAEMIAALNFT